MFPSWAFLRIPSSDFFCVAHFDVRMREYLARTKKLFFPEQRKIFVAKRILYRVLFERVTLIKIGQGTHSLQLTPD